MRKRLFALAGSTALGVASAVALSVPANSIQLAPIAGVAADTNVIQVQDRRGPGGRGGPGPSGGGFSARTGGPGPAISGRGRVQIQGGPGVRGGFEARGQVQRRDFSPRNFSRGPDRGPRGVEARGEIKRGDFKLHDFKRSAPDRKDFSRWSGRHPKIVHRGWSRDHRFRFFGAFLIGVPFGYAAISTHPCYDWVYGPRGWGYYWNYDRCPV